MNYYGEWVYIDKNQDSDTKFYVETDTIYKVEVEETAAYEYYIESDEENKKIAAIEALHDQTPIEIIDRQWIIEENNNA